MQSLKKKQVGVVVSNKMDKTVVVSVPRKIKHSLVNKYYTKQNKIKAHDEKNECGVGDKVQIRECAPISREKRWVVVGVVEKAVSV